MYLQHFGLEKNPFSLTADPQFLFLTSKNRESLAALIFGVTARKGFMVMTGEAGTGKTTLVAKLRESFLPTSAHFSVVINPVLTRAELLESILMDFGVTDVPSSKPVRLQVFKDVLFKINAEGKVPVLVIDEAHLLGPDLIEEIRLLLNFEIPEHKLLQIVLVGQKELNNILNLPSMTQVRQRVAIRMQLDPLDRSDIDRYLRTRWTRAGGRESMPFSAEAVQSIARFSVGVPRLVNAICDAALVNAYGTGREKIGSEEILEVVTDLQLDTTGRIRGLLHPAEVALSGKAPELPTLERYLPSQKQRRRLNVTKLNVTNWFRFAHTEGE